MMSPEQDSPASGLGAEPITPEEATMASVADLGRMLDEARSAQLGSDSVGQGDQVETAAMAEASLASSIKERNEILMQRRVAETEQQKTTDLLAQGIELSKASESTAPETETFLEVATRTVQERVDELRVLKERLITLDADPAVRSFLYQEALEEGRRIQVQKDYQECYYIKTQDGQHRGTLHEVLRQVAPESSKVSGTCINNDPICQLESFTFQVSGLAKGEKPKGTLDEAEDAARRLTTIREEVESGNPDLQKIDSVLADFLHRRLEHFFATLDQRVGSRAQQLADYYQSHPKDAENYRCPTTIEDWKSQLTNSMRDISTLKFRANQVMDSDGLRAKRLAQIGDDVFQRANGIGGGDQYPFFADNYKEPSNDQLVA